MSGTPSRRERWATAAVVITFALAAGWWLWQTVPEALGQAPLPPALAVVGQAGGAARAVAVERGRAVLGVGQRLFVLDVNDPANPVETTQTPLLAGTVRDVAMAEGYAFAALGQAGVTAVDLLPQPPLVVALRPLGQEIGRVVAANGLVYALGPTGLFVLDPGTLTVVGRTVLGVHNPADATTGDLAVAGNWAYALRQDGLDIVDVADPAAPALVGAWRGTADAVAVTPDGRHLLVATAMNLDPRPQPLRVLDVTNPARPRQVAELTGGGHRIALNGDQAWLIDGFRVAPDADVIRVVDVSDPRQPRVVSTTPRSPALTDLAIADDVVFVTADGDGLHTFAAAEPSQPARLGGWVTRPVNLATLVGGTAYTLTDRMLQVLDTTDPAAPRRVGELDLGMAARSVAARGGFVYVGGAGGDLRVIDASEPARPSQVAAVQVGNVTIHGLFATGRYLWLATDGALASYDVSAPASPKRVGWYQLPCYDVAVADGRAYVAAGQAGLVVLDARDPAAPRELGRLSFASAYPGGGDAFANQVVVDAGTAYVGLGRDGVVVVGAQDPAKPRELSRVGAIESTTALARSGDLLLAADHPDGPPPANLRPLQVIDPRDPQRPRLLVGPAIDAGLTDVASDGGLTVVAAEGGGLLLLRPVTEVPATPTLIARDTATPRPRPTRPPATPNPAWRRMALLPFAVRPAEQYIPCPDGCGTTIAGQQGGSARVVATESDRLYLMVGDRLAVYGLADPNKPTLLGQTAPLPGTGQRLLVKDGVAYVVATVPDPAATTGLVAVELLAVDARAPATPRMVSRSRFARSDDDYLADGLQLAWMPAKLLVLWPSVTEEPKAPRLSTFDVSDPLRPRLTDMTRPVGHFGPIGTQLAAVGGLVALAGTLYSDGAKPAATFRLLDLGVAAAEPKVVGQAGLDQANMTSIAAGEKFVFLGENGLVRVVDASVPTKPKLLGRNEAYRIPAGSLVLDGGTLYGASASSGEAPAIGLTDVRDPYRPVRLGSVTLAAPDGGAHLADSLAVAAAHAYQPEGAGSGLRIVDSTTPAKPRELAPLPDLGLAACLSPHAGHLLVGWPARSQVASFDRSAPSHPTLSATASTWSAMRGVRTCRLVTVSPTAYLGGPFAPLDVLNVFDPSDIHAIAGLPDPDDQAHDYRGLTVAGKRAWRAWGELGLLPIDLADPAQPRALPRIAGTYANDVAVTGDLAYVAAGREGMSVLDVRDVATVRELGYLALNGTATELALGNGIVWIALERDPRPGTVYEPAEVVAADVADPAKPRVVGSVDLPGRVRRLRLDGTTLWVASEAGLLRVTASDPTHPRLRERIAPYTGVVDVVTAPGWAYAASDTGALWSVQVAP